MLGAGAGFAVTEKIVKEAQTARCVLVLLQLEGRTLRKSPLACAETPWIPS